MAKKKLFKDDGSEDFDAEALEQDDTFGSDVPQVDEAAKDAEAPKSDATPGDSAATLPSTEAADGASGLSGSSNAVSDDTAKSDAASITPSDSGASTTSGDESTAPGASSDASAASASDASDAVEPPVEQPELSDTHPEAQPAVDVAPDVLDALKEAGNKVTPELAKLGEFEEKIAELEDEAKNRFVFLRQKATEFVAALEGMFKRG